MRRTEEVQNNIQGAWLEATEKNAFTAHILKLIIYFFFFAQPIGIVILVVQSGNSPLIYFLGLGAYIPISIYVFFYVNKLPRLIERRTFQNISYNLPESLAKVSAEILDVFHIPNNYIEYWVNNKSTGISPTVVSYKKKYHVIFPLGYFNLLDENELQAKQVLAHELSHIRQRDTDLLLTFKVFLRSAFYFFIPFQLITTLISIFRNLGYIDDAKAQRAGAYVGILSSNSQSAFDYFSYAEGNLESVYDKAVINIGITITVTLSFILFFIYARKWIFRSEHTADMGGVVLGSSDSMSQVIQNNASAPNWRSRFSINPSAQWRINKLLELEKKIPGAGQERSVSNTRPDVFNPYLSIWSQIFCCFVVFVFPLGFTFTLYQLAANNAFGRLNGFVAVMMLVKAVLIIIGFNLGIDFLKNKKGVLEKIGWYCLINLVFVFIDTTGTIMVMEVPWDLFLPVLARTSFLSIILFAVSYFHFRKKSLGKPVNLHDFRSYEYQPNPVYNIALGLRKGEFYILLLFLILIIPCFFFLWYHILFIDPFGYHFTFMQYLESVFSEPVLYIILFFADLAGLILAIICFVQLLQRSIEASMLIKALMGLQMLILTARYFYLITEDSLKERNWYFFSYKLEDGYLFGNLLHLFVISLILILIVLWLIKKYGLKKDLIFLKTILRIGITTAILTIVSAFSDIPKNEDLLNTIRFSGPFGVETQVHGIDRDASLAITMEEVDSMNTKVLVWKLNTGEAFGTKNFKGESYFSVRTKFNPFTEQIVVGISDSILIFTSDLKQKLKSYSIPYEYDFGFSYDQSVIAYTLRNDGYSSVRIDNMEKGTKVHLADSTSSVTFESLSPNGSVVIVKYGNMVLACDALTTRVLYEIPIEEYSKCIFSPDSKTMFFQESYSGGGLGRLVDAYTGQLIARIDIGGYRTQYAFSGSGKYLAIFDDSSFGIEIVNLKGKKIKSIRDNREISSVFFSTDDKFIITGGRDAEIKKFKTGL